MIKSHQKHHAYLKPTLRTTTGLQTMTPFSKEVIHLIQKIPQGRVATYGQLAFLAGNPQGARGVVWILHSASESHQLPWQRVINSKGKISFSPYSKKNELQKNLLRKEGVEVSEEGFIDLEQYGWNTDTLHLE